MSEYMEQTEFGFRWGPVIVERLASDDKRGWVAIAVLALKSLWRAGKNGEN